MCASLSLGRDKKFPWLRDARLLIFRTLRFLLAICAASVLRERATPAGKGFFYANSKRMESIFHACPCARADAKSAVCKVFSAIV